MSSPKSNYSTASSPEPVQRLSTIVPLLKLSLRLFASRWTCRVAAEVSVEATIPHRQKFNHMAQRRISLCGLGGGCDKWASNGFYPK
jgi:hypothetical protein